MTPAAFLSTDHGHVTAEHRHAPRTDGQDCEPGIVARCGACLVWVAPCSRSHVDVKVVLSGTFRCAGCALEAP